MYRHFNEEGNSNHNIYTAVVALLCSLLWPQALQQVISKINTIFTQLSILTCVKACERLGNIVVVVATVEYFVSIS